MIMNDGKAILGLVVGGCGGVGGGGRSGRRGEHMFETALRTLSHPVSPSLPPLSLVIYLLHRRPSVRPLSNDCLTN